MTGLLLPDLTDGRATTIRAGILLGASAMTWLTSRLTKKSMKQRKVRRRSASQPSSSTEGQAVDEIEEECVDERVDLPLEEGEAIAGQLPLFSFPVSLTLPPTCPYSSLSSP